MITHKLTITQKVKPKMINKPSKCDVCGASITWFNRARHLKTKKHKDVLYANHIKFEIKQYLVN